MGANRKETKSKRLEGWGDSMMCGLRGVARKRVKREASKKRRQMVKRNVAMAVVVLLMLGCAGVRASRDTLFFAQELYIAQYDDYIIQAARVDLTEDDKKILRIKRGVLVELEPKIKLMKQYLDTGTVPPDGLETEVIRLTKLLMGVV